METIFLQKSATRKTARSANDDLSIEIEDDDNSKVNMSPNVAAALVKSGGDDDTIPDDLWEVVSDTIGFAEGYLAHYYAHLVDNPKIARAFMSLRESNRLIWVGRVHKLRNKSSMVAD
ncbi:hypothetical protein D1007_53786 [Hordeum vulgare]|nr:hypothetical protein D1007_53786 [Hordeum vulgare]